MDKELILEIDEQVQALEESENTSSINLFVTRSDVLDEIRDSIPRISIKDTNRFSDLTEGDKFTTDKIYELAKSTLMTFIAHNQTFRNYLDKLDESVDMLSGNISKNRYYEMCKSFSAADGICDCCGSKVILSNDALCHKCRDRMNYDFYVRSVIVADMDDVVMKYLDNSQRVNLNSFY